MGGPAWAPILRHPCCRPMLSWVPFLLFQGENSPLLSGSCGPPCPGDTPSREAHPPPHTHTVGRVPGRLSAGRGNRLRPPGKSSALTPCDSDSEHVRGGGQTRSGLRGAVSVRAHTVGPRGGCPSSCRVPRLRDPLSVPPLTPSARSPRAAVVGSACTLRAWSPRGATRMGPWAGPSRPASPAPRVCAGTVKHLPHRCAPCTRCVCGLAGRPGPR